MNQRLDLSALVNLQNRQRRAAGATAGGGDGRLAEVAGFGADPGNLRMLAYVPAGLPEGAPLVVAMHGCTQTAAGYDGGSGWSAMADRLGFAVLLPEQRRANNAHLCFNWFEPGDIARGAGEAASIRAMIGHMLGAHGLDASRVFVTGLSAGGAMASVMLAAYPEVFAGGAIVAGLPYGVAGGVSEALGAMSRPQTLSAASRGGSVKAAGAHRGPWPRVAVWHGDADTTVSPGNAEESVKQWLHLHGLTEAPSAESRADGHHRRAWHGPDGVARVEAHRIAGMAHGVPLRPGEEGEACGVAGAYLLDVGLSSTHGILEFWGIEGARMAPIQTRGAAGAAPAGAFAGMAASMKAGSMGAGSMGADFMRAAGAAARAAGSGAAHPGATGPGASSSGATGPGATGPGAVITNALRAAGLMR